MKKIKEIIKLGIFFIAILITSCENEPLDSSFAPENGGGTTTTGGATTGFYFRVTKDGALKQWSTVQALNSIALNSFIISAADSSTSMNLVLFSVSKIGVYNLSWAEKSCVYTEGTNIFSSDYSDFNTSAGNITITELNKTDKTIKGTFNFIGKNEAMTVTKVFTKGEFFIKYTEQ